MEKLALSDFVLMWEHALESIRERAGEFSRLDALTGDGDHGTAMVQALSSAVEEARKGTEYRAMLNDMGFAVMMHTSGSTGTLMGGFLLGMSENAEGTELDSSQVRQMFKGGLEGVQKQTKAGSGDKTMMDTLIPAVGAMLESETADIRRLFSVAAEAAATGAAATVAMKANFGRARNYGERSVGHADPGALSWACMFEAFNKSLIKT